ncbi:MAG TPA: glutamine amidotransferase, partial [Gemmataceae bacterium]|nr:glutamine amidotransferase [Gemmataceae bacterium]
GTLGAIYRLVNESGSGLLMMGGLDSFGTSWRGTEIAKLLPVQIEGPAQQLPPPIKMVPTEAGLRHYLLRLADRPDENAAVWAKLEPLYGCSQLGPPKDGATVLARVGDKETGQPLLVMQNYGAGRTLAFGGDTTFYWRRDEQGVQAHARFWKQLVLWLAKQEESSGSVWVKPDARRLAAGGKLGFGVGLRGKGGVELKEGQFKVKVVGPQDATSAVPTARDRDEERGTFFKTDAPGEYRLVVTGKGKDVDGQEISGQATARFLVYEDDAELVRRAADHDFLKKLAAAGGGQFLRPEDLPKFLQKMQAEQLLEGRPKVAAWPDWRQNHLSPFVVVLFLLFVALLSGEWLLRRRWGLV